MAPEMPEPPAYSAPSGHRPCRYTLAALILAAILAQVLAMASVRHLRGDVAAYAFQSPDAAEYLNLARGIAWHGQYTPCDASGRALAGPDTWRTPGYPLFLALPIRVAGDSPLALLMAQQLLAAATVPLLWLVLRPLTRPRWAILAALAWCLDPFRLYYSLWLMSETLFTFVLLLACWLWVRRASGLGVESPSATSQFSVLSSQSSRPATSSIRNLKFEIRDSFLLGLLAGLLVLIRPIALPLPLLAIAGVAIVNWRAARGRREASPDHWCENPFSHPAPAGIPSRDPAPARRHPKSEVRNRLFPGVLACSLGVVAALAPWLLRNRVLTGHLAISQQSGASLAYHKVVDIVLWSEGRPQYRFDPDATAEVRDRIDQRVRREWPARYGPLTNRQLETLTWHNLNFGKPVAVDPFKASSMLWSVGLHMLADRPWATLKCFAVQGLFMLIFPLGLVLWPPAGSGSAPLSMILGGKGLLAAKVIPAALGAAYAALTFWIVVRLVIAAVHRRWPAGLFAFWPALAMFVFSLPSEDPRFRLPLIPLFWILAVAQNRVAFPPTPRSNPDT
jgi:hypothetical protein